MKNSPLAYVERPDIYRYPIVFGSNSEVIEEFTLSHCH